MTRDWDDPLAEHMVAWVSDSAPPAKPSPDGKRRLLDSLSGPERFRPFFATMRELFDLDDDRLRAELRRVDEPGAWQTAFPSAWFFNFTPGPGAGAAEGGFVKVARGATFPLHRHQAREIAIVLQGTLLLNGRTYHPGDVIPADTGSEHQFSAGGHRDLVIMVAHSGVEFLS